MIDAPATAARAMGALAFANGVAGELYFDVDYVYDFADPWVSRIGGAHDVPVESLRIVQIARGLADYGYLSLCAQLGDPALARAEAQAVAPGLRTWSRDH